MYGTYRNTTGTARAHQHAQILTTNFTNFGGGGDNCEGARRSSHSLLSSSVWSPLVLIAFHRKHSTITSWQHHHTVQMNLKLMFFSYTCTPEWLLKHYLKLFV